MSLKYVQKALMPLLILFLLSMYTYAKNSFSRTTQVEIGLGYTRSLLNGGMKIIRP